MEKQHRLVKRQVKRFLSEVLLKASPETKTALDAFITAVSQAYEDFDADRRLLERSMEISSKELFAGQPRHETTEYRNAVDV